MLNIAASLFLILFAISIIFTYMAIRFNWLRIPAAVLLGAVSNVLFLVLYSLLKGNTFTQAITVGLGLGLLSTLGAVSVSLFFNANRDKRAPGASDNAKQ